MSTSPFFSVLLPTKNRSHIVGYAIQSILNQSFEDFEIILVDNDDSDATAKRVKEFSDSRLKYFRTGSLIMWDNWEFALKQAQGRFVTVLEDKQAYYPYALERIHQTINEHSAQVIVWGWDIYNDHFRTASSNSRGKGVEMLKSDYILKLYSTNPLSSWEFLPRMLNSCISHEQIINIKALPQVDAFFSKMSPDLCASFYTLANIDRLFFIRESLGLTGYFQLSNAKKIMEDPKNKFSYFGSDFSQELLTDHVPIKEHRLLHNAIYNDFLRIRGKFMKQLQHYQMTPEVYARLCLADLARIPYTNGYPELFNAVMTYVKNNSLSRIRLLLYFLKSIFVRILGELSWLRKLRDKLKNKTWKADNILKASLHEK